MTGLKLAAFKNTHSAVNIYKLAGWPHTHIRFMCAHGHSYSQVSLVMVLVDTFNCLKMFLKNAISPVNSSIWKHIFILTNERANFNSFCVEMHTQRAILHDEWVVFLQATRQHCLAATGLHHRLSAGWWKKNQNFLLLTLMDLLCGCVFCDVFGFSCVRKSSDGMKCLFELRPMWITVR